MISNVDRLVFLMDEIRILKERIQPTDTGHLHTTVDVLYSRVEEVTKQLNEENRNEIKWRYKRSFKKLFSNQS